MKKTFQTMRIHILLILLLMGTNGYARQTVTGRVFDLATHQGFAGVRISVVDTKLTTMSVEDGTFTIEVPALDVTFSVDAPGYQNQIVALKGRTELDIYLLQQTGAPSFYDGTEFSTVAMASVSDFSVNIPSIDEDLTSRLSGQIRAILHSGAATNGSAVFARGYNSLNASAQPR
jgi:hypothetical protein